MTLADLPPSSSATRLTVRRRQLADPLPARVEPVKLHHVDVGVGGDGLADDRADAGDQVEHAGGQADLVDDLGEDERVERRHLADGLSTTVQPAASAGATLAAIWCSG